MRWLGYLFWLFIVALGAIFSVLNAHFVTLNYYFGTITLYFPLLLVMQLAVGSLLGIFAMLPVVWRARYKRRKLKQRIREIEQELFNLRQLPIRDHTV